MLFKSCICTQFGVSGGCRLQLFKIKWCLKLILFADERILIDELHFSAFLNERGPGSLSPASHPSPNSYTVTSWLSPWKHTMTSERLSGEVPGAGQGVQELVLVSDLPERSGESFLHRASRAGTHLTGPQRHLPSPQRELLSWAVGLPSPPAGGSCSGPITAG